MSIVWNALKNSTKNFFKFIIENHEALIAFLMLLLSFVFFNLLDDKWSILIVMSTMIITCQFIQFVLNLMKLNTMGFPQLKRRYTKLLGNGEVRVEKKDIQLAIMTLYCFEEFAERNGFIQDEEN